MPTGRVVGHGHVPLSQEHRHVDTERLVCESLADGRLTVTLSATHMNRASWGCFATAPAP